jgi:hypothetical protein
MAGMTRALLKDGLAGKGQTATMCERDKLCGFHGKVGQRHRKKLHVATPRSA